jgi:hypothetical protein
MKDEAFSTPVKVRLSDGAKIQRIASAQEAFILLESANRSTRQRNPDRLAARQTRSLLSIRA